MVTLENTGRGTEMLGWRWCILCSSGSHLDSLAQPPAQQRYATGIFFQSRAFNVLPGIQTQDLCTVNATLHQFSEMNTWLMKDISFLFHQVHSTKGSHTVEQKYYETFGVHSPSESGYPLQQRSVSSLLCMLNEGTLCDL